MNKRGKRVFLVNVNEEAVLSETSPSTLGQLDNCAARCRAAPEIWSRTVQEGRGFRIVKSDTREDTNSGEDGIREHHFAGEVQYILRHLEDVFADTLCFLTEPSPHGQLWVHKNLPQSEDLLAPHTGLWECL